MQNEIQIRLNRIREKMREENIEACLISSNVNLFYASGIIFSGYLFFRQTGESLFFIKRPQGITGENVFYIRKPEQIGGILKELQIAEPETIWLEGDEMTHSEWLRLEKVFPGSKAVNSTTALRQVRSVKTAYELELIREGGRRQSEAFRVFPSLYKPGMTDHEFAVEMEYEIRKRGSLGIFRIFGQSMEAFMGTVLTGENAGAPSAYDFALGGQGLHPSIPIGQSGLPILSGQTVMVDICGNFNGYSVDQTRIFSVGKTTPEAIYAHQVSMEISDTLAEMGKPGVVCEDLYEKALEIAKKHRLEDSFMGRIQQASFVGHGIGLVLNELPVLCRKNKEILREGMTIALEPKFIIDKIGAVGNENTCIVCENGMEKVTTAPEEIVLLT
jgi:Xaa-Pro aminopeptidase